MLFLFRAAPLSKMRRKFHVSHRPEVHESGAPVSYRAVVIAGLPSVSPEEHSLIIRAVGTDECDQFRIHCLPIEKVCYYTKIINKLVNYLYLDIEGELV